MIDKSTSFRKKIKALPWYIHEVIFYTILILAVIFLRYVGHCERRGFSEDFERVFQLIQAFPYVDKIIVSYGDNVHEISDATHSNFSFARAQLRPLDFVSTNTSLGEYLIEHAATITYHIGDETLIEATLFFVPENITTLNWTHSYLFNHFQGQRVIVLIDSENFLFGRFENRMLNLDAVLFN